MALAFIFWLINFNESIDNFLSFNETLNIFSNNSLYYYFTNNWKLCISSSVLIEQVKILFNRSNKISNQAETLIILEDKLDHFLHFLLCLVLRQ